MEDQTQLKQQPLPPLVKGKYPIGSAFDFIRDSLGFFEEVVPKYGGIFQVRSIFFPFISDFDYMMIVSDPDMVKHIMQDNNKNYVKSHGYNVLKVLLGEGLLTSEGDFWRKQRRLMQPAFHRDRLASFVDTYVEFGQQLVDKWKTLPDGSEVDVSKDFMETTLNIVSKAMFSSDVADAMEVVNREFDYANEQLIKRITSPFPIPLWVPLPHIQKESRSYAAIKNVVADIIEKRRASDQRYDDLLSMLMEVEDADTGEKMSDQQIQDEVITIFLAGHETTAVALTWLVHCLDENPEVEQKLIEEESRVLNGRQPNLEDLHSLEYTRMVIDETLRLYPPAWIIGRHATEEDQLGNYRIPKDSNCLIPVYYIHRDPKLWDRPEEFRPERFSKENSKGRHKFVYFPFGGGPRLCIGNNFALMEMQIIVPMVVRAIKLRKSKGFQFKKEPLITMRPAPHMKMVLTKRG
ncbi:MAG: cytochrome P450 [Flavobacteriales bacterium]|nr:cytochrome P450 [Flavobacteriales bacterium]MCB9205593.1 cytochrome P450 [Flavobacteriales bacterium]